MKLEIGDKIYDGDAQPFIGDLRLLKPEFGFGFGTVMQRMSRLSQTPLFEMLDDDEFVEALTAYLWMAKLRAGERHCTRADIEKLSMDQIRFIPDREDEPEAPPDPSPAPAATARGDGQPAETAEVPTVASTKTSRQRSTRASR